jgi:organic radical activating enzyme
MKSVSLCVLACQWCTHPHFWAWINATDFDGVRYYIRGKEEAAEFLQKICKITSRKDLDLIKSSAVVFDVKVRIPYMAWRRIEAQK